MIGREEVAVAAAVAGKKRRELNRKDAKDAKRKDKEVRKWQWQRQWPVYGLRLRRVDSRQQTKPAQLWVHDCT